MSDFWAAFWTALATVALLVVPVVVYAYYALDGWIGNEDNYDRVMATVEHRNSRTGS